MGHETTAYWQLLSKLRRISYRYGLKKNITPSCFLPTFQLLTSMEETSLNNMEDRLKTTRIVSIDQIYVPVKRKKTLELKKVETIAESILDEGQKTPIQVREGDGRLVLVEGLHRLEACRALGENSIEVIFVQARRF